MLTRDFYIATLEKRASEDALNDSQETALQEYAENTKDNKAYVGNLFDNTDAVEKATSREAGKLFPGKSEKESGYMFMKVARAIFESALSQVQTNPMMKTASYREVAFHSFCSELEKIGWEVGQPIQPAEMGSYAAGKDINYQKHLLRGGTPAPVAAAHGLAEREISALRAARPANLAAGSVVSKLPVK